VVIVMTMQLPKFFSTSKTRVIKRKVYSQRDDAKTAIFNFIEMFYDPLKRHSHKGDVSSAKYEVPYLLESNRV
jgi:putative transposase